MCNSILIVDDDHDLREAFADALRFAGYVVRTAADGQAALKLLAEFEPPCLILLDIMMPGMNGEEFLKRQLADPNLAQIPVVVLTADQGTLQKSSALGAAGGLAKPVGFKELSDVARKFCGEAT